MPRDLLAEEVGEVAVFGTLQGGAAVDGADQEKLMPAPGFIGRFLKEGVYRPRSPYGEKRRNLRARAEVAAERWKAANPANGFDETPLSPEREAELEGFREEAEALKERYARFFSIEGAMMDANGRILLWRLLSPVFLQLECRDGLCFLELDKEAAVTLVAAPTSSAEIELPDLSRGKVSHFRFFFPPTGDDQEISVVVVRDFLEQGRPVPKARLLSPDNPCRFVTTHWLDGSRLRIFPDLSRDRMGNPIVGGLPLGSGGSFASVFPDRAGHLWLAELLTDAHLKLTDRRGRSVILEHPVVLTSGHGREKKNEP